MIGREPKYWSGFPSGVFASPVIANTSPDAECALIYADKGLFWHNLYFGAEITEAFSAFGVAANAPGAVNVYWGEENRLMRMPVPYTSFNPLTNSLSTYAEEGFLVTPWVDFGAKLTDKILISLGIEVENMTPNGLQNYVTVEYAINGSDEWEPFMFIADNGFHSKKFTDINSEPRGIPIRKVRFRYWLYRDKSSIRTTPVFKGMKVRYTVAEDITWGYVFDIDTSKPLDGRTPEQQEAEYYTIIAKKELIPFRYRSGQEEGWVRPHISNSQETTGVTKESHYQVTLLEAGDA